MMTEFKFFANREERWSDSMRALWGSLSMLSPPRPCGPPISHGGGTAFYKPP